MTKNDDLPKCVRSTSSRTDPEFLVNEFLIKNGYFDTVERIKEENNVLRKDRTAFEREIAKLNRSILTRDEEITATRRRCAQVEEAFREQYANYEKRLAECRTRETELLAVIQQHRSELERCKTVLESLSSRAKSPRIEVAHPPRIPEPVAVSQSTLSHIGIRSQISAEEIMRSISMVIPPE
jgi:prefoldin subunit 5